MNLPTTFLTVVAFSAAGSALARLALAWGGWLGYALNKEVLELVVVQLAIAAVCAVGALGIWMRHRIKTRFPDFVNHD